MKNKNSSLVCFAVGLALIVFRCMYTDKDAVLPVKVTTWDALGYYMYLPAQFIYQDEKELKWFPEIDSIYSLSGGELYQANKQKNGNYVFKYLEGVSILQIPFFLIAHLVALNSHYPADGFSAPYQYAIAWGCIFYCLLAIFMLRTILLRYYNDVTVALSLALLLLASNFIQYVAVEGGQSHGYIFPLYVFVVYATIKWHDNKKLVWSFLIGFILGVATISRPTEIVMLFIPLIWGVNTRKEFTEKIIFFKQHYSHIVFVFSGVVVGILPQLLYWKRVTGSFVYDVGSKWDFLNPHFRVLLGWEKGWFIYTPVTLLFVAGLFFMKKQPFAKAIILFCILNIYIVIAWHVWRYGGSYSCRALVQSYPIFAFPLAGFVAYAWKQKWKYIFLILSAYLIFVNLFQLKQYNRNILHYDEMNFSYYRAIYLNTHPTPLDMSLLDTKDVLRNETGYENKRLYPSDSTVNLHHGNLLFEDSITVEPTRDVWLKVDAGIKITNGMWGSSIEARLKPFGFEKEVSIRLFNALSVEGKINEYEFYLKVPSGKQGVHLELSIEGNEQFEGFLQHIRLIKLSEK